MNSQRNRSLGRVILLLVDLSGGGTQKVVEGLAAMLLDVGSELTVISAGSPVEEWSTRGSSARVLRLPGHFDPRMLHRTSALLPGMKALGRSALLIRRTVMKSGSDTPVLAFLPGANLLAAASCFGLRNPLILSERNDVTRQPVSGMVRLGRRLLYRRAAAITTNRAEDRAAIARMAPNVPIVLVPNPPPQSTVRAHPKASRVIVTVGRLVGHKRHIDVISAFHAVAPHFLDWTLRIVGEGPERAALTEFISRHRLEGRVTLVGHTEDVPSELQKSAVLVHSSDYEGTPNALMEGMAAGLPCVVTETCLPSDLGNSIGHHVRTFPQRDTAALAQHLSQLMTDPDLRAQEGAHNRTLVGSLTAPPSTVWPDVIALARNRRSRAYQCGHGPLGRQ